MREWLYRLLVDRVPGIRDRYLRLRRRHGGRVRAALCLLWWNAQYYLLFRRSLRQPVRTVVWEEKTLYSGGSESSLSRREAPEAFAARLAEYDVVSFDVFDTLLLRPFSHPTDLFYLVGIALEYPDFRHTRIECEERARQKTYRERGTYEVTLREIWEEMERQTGIPCERGMQTEWDCEKKCCFANPYMLRVVRELRRRGRPLAAVSDMYLGADRIRELLSTNGYGEWEDSFVSCDYGVSKGDGGLYEVLRKAVGQEHTIAHVGDNEQSDVRQARRHGIVPFWYAPVQSLGGRYRAEDLSAVTGSLYRGLVNAQLHNGLTVYSREYEYGFVYGGLFVTGYCRFIHRYAREHDMEKLLFLSRDGAVLLRAYRLLYPDEAGSTVYAYWSRLAAVKLTAGYYRQEYFRRFLFHKADGRIPLRRALEAMELPHLLPPLCRAIKGDPDTPLTYKTAGEVKSYLQDHWEEVEHSYEKQREAAGIYYRELLRGCRRAAAVDVGWAGSGAVMLAHAARELWEIPCEITGLLAGTQAERGPGEDMSEPFLFGGRLSSYLYSQRENRDLWKLHDPADRHNLYWELLLGAPEGSLLGFYPDGDGRAVPRLKDPPPHADRIREIHRGILDFVRRFWKLEQRIGQEIPVSGRDAYAPMISVGSRRNKPFREGLEALLDDMHIG